MGKGTNYDFQSAVMSISISAIVRKEHSFLYVNRLKDYFDLTFQLIIFLYLLCVLSWRQIFTYQ